ncbi:putative tRNA(fMet)-specific endonuclease VapC [Hollandina sp. SP2]
MIFLDTNILSYYFAGNIKIRDKILEAINEGEELCLTSINVYEILKGYRWRKSTNKEKIFKEFLKNINIFSIDDEIIELAATIYAELRETGKTVDDADIIIASIVISNNGKLVSHNRKHFKDIKELQLLNWLE